MDLAKLGIEVDYRETKDVNAELGKISTSTDKIIKKAKLASDALSKIGATGTGGLDKNKTATDKITKSYLDLLVMLENVKKSFAQLGSTQTGTKEMQKNLAIVTTELKKSREAGELNATTYKRLATESDKLAVKLNERASALKALNTGEYEAQRIAAKDLKTKQQRIEIEKLHVQALKENVEINKRWAVATQNNVALVAKESKERKAESDAIKQGMLLREKERNIMASDNRRANIVEISRETKARKEYLAVMKAEIIAGEAQRAKEKASIQALNTFKENQIALQKKVAASYDYHDKEAQKYHENLKKQQSLLGRLSEAYANTTARIKQFAAFIAAAFVVQGITQGFRGAINIIIDFDQALKSLQAIAGATATEASVMGNVIKQMAADTKFSAQEVAEGMQTIGKAGFTAEEALKMIQGVSNLATGALEDFNTVAGLVVTAIRAFGLEVVQTNEITDIFANAITKSKLSTDMLVTAFGYVGAAGAQAGLTLNEVSGTLMVLSDNGIRASTMGTALRKTLLSMIAPNEALKSALYSVGMSVKDINPGMVGYEQALRNIAPLVWDFERNTVDMAKAQEFFGIRASQVAAILIRETAQGGGISRAIESTKELGAALKMAEKQQEGLGVKFKNLADTIKNVALAVGEAGLTNVLHTLVDALKAAASMTEKFIQSFPIVQMAGYVAAILAISGAVYGLIKALGIAKTAIFAFNAGLLTTPLGLFITGATAAAGIAAYFKNKLEDTSESFKKNSIIIDENVSTLEGWGRVLDEAAKKGLAEYNAAIVRFVFENKEMSDAVIQNINDQQLLGDQSASTMDQVFELAGTFENFTEVVKKARENVHFEEQIQSIKELTSQAELLGSAYKKAADDLDLWSNPNLAEHYKAEDIQKKIDESVQNLKAPAAKLEAVGTDIANHIFNMYKLKENGAKFAAEYIAQMKEATDLPDAFWTALETQMTAKFTNLGKDAGGSTVTAFKKILADLPKEIMALEKTIPTIKIFDYEKDKKEWGEKIAEMFAMTKDSLLFKESGQSVDDLLKSFKKLHDEGLVKVITGADEAKEKALDMSKAFERLKKTVADQEELKALELKVRKIKELGSVKKAELYIENKLEEARINSLNLGPEKTKLYKELIAFIKERTKAEEELEKQIADDKALKDRALALTQEIVLLQDYLDNLKKGVSIKKADNIAERERARLSMINQGLDENQIKRVLDLKEAIKDKTAAITAGTEAQEKQEKAVKDAYADMRDTIQDYTADIVADWDNAGDMLVDIAKRTAAEMAAAFLTQQFIMPMVQTIGGAMGMSWNGVPMSAMGGMGGAVQAQQAGLGIPSGSALTWAGNNIPGMGALGSAMAWNMPGTGLAVNTSSAAASLGVPQAGTSFTVGGTSLGTSLGYGAWGSLGYQYLGGALGLPQGKYSGLGAGVGGALGGTYAGAAMSAMGMAGAGAAAGSVVPVVGTIIGAVIGGLIGSFGGGSKKEPKVRVLSGQWGEGHGGPGELNSDFGYRTWIQDVEGSGNRSEIGNAMMQVFDAQLQAIEDATSWGLKEALAGTSFRSTAKFKDHDNDLETAFTAMSDDVFRQINQSLVSAMGLSSVGLDTSFFEGLRADGETLLQTFARFATIAESIDDFSGRMDQQMSSGKTAEQAFGNLVVIAETLQAVTSATDAIGTSSGINNVRNMIQAQSDYMKALKTAVATQDELAQVQIGISQQIGASISGLTADSLQSVLASGGDITGILQATVKNTAAQTIAGLASESIMAEYGNSLNQLIGDAFKNINAEDLNASDLTDALNDILTDFDWEGLESAAGEAAAAIKEFAGAGADFAATEKARAQLEIQIMELQGDAIGALIAQRQIEYDALEATIKPLQIRVWALQDEARAQAQLDSAKSEYLSGLRAEQSKLESIASNARSNYISGLQAEQRALESIASSARSNYISGLRAEQSKLEDIASNARSNYISGLQAEQKALEDAVASTKSEYATALSLAGELAEIMGDEESARGILNRQRELELESMDASLRPMQERLWLLQGEVESLGDLKTAIQDVDKAIHAMMGGSDIGLKSKEYMDDRYNRLKSSAESDPAQAQAFIEFASEYVDFMSDYGDPKVREEALRDLQRLQERYLKQKSDVEKKWDRSSAELYDLNSLGVINSKQNAYIDAKQELNDSWYEAELEILDPSNLEDISDLQTQYLNAQQELNDSWYQSELEILDPSNLGDIGELQTQYLNAKQSLNNSWYQSELEILDPSNLGSISNLQTQYLNAKQSLNNSWYQSEIRILEGSIASIESLKEKYNSAKANLDSVIANPPMPIQDMPSFAGLSGGELVTALYGSIGRTNFGSRDNQIDPAGFDYWSKSASEFGSEHTIKAFMAEVNRVLPDHDYVQQYIKDTYDIDRMPYVQDLPSFKDLPSFAGLLGEELVTALYKSIGRTGFGTRDDQIDRAGYDYWGESASEFGSEHTIKAFMAEVNRVLSDHDYVQQYIKDTYGIDRMPYAGGGVLSGPMSGYDVNATFHGTEAIIPLQNGFVPVKMQGGDSKRVEDLLTKLISITNKDDGRTEIRVYVGNKELKDITAETIRTDPETQRTIKRVVNV